MFVLSFADRNLKATWKTDIIEYIEKKVSNVAYGQPMSNLVFQAELIYTFLLC